MRDPGNDISAVAVITWAGTRYYAVRILYRTKHRVACALTHPLSPQSLHLLGKRVVGEMAGHERGRSFLVPKEAIRHVPEEKLEQDFYPGAIYGYGGTVDARR